MAMFQEERLQLLSLPLEPSLAFKSPVPAVDNTGLALARPSAWAGLWFVSLRAAQTGSHGGSIQGVELEIPEGVKAFNFWTLSIMARLWESFPRPSYFYSTPGGTVYVTSDRVTAGEPFGTEGHDQVELFTDSLNWLLREGFVSGVANGAGAFTNVSLTTRGFSILSEVPHSIAERAAEKPLGSLIREAVASQGVGLFAGLIQAILLPKGQ